MKAPKWDANSEIRWALSRAYGPLRLAGLLWMLGIRRNRNGRYSKTAYKKYEVVSRALQKMKRNGEVALKRGYTPGWVLSRKERTGG